MSPLGFFAPLFNGTHLASHRQLLLWIVIAELYIHPRKK